KTMDQVAREKIKLMKAFSHRRTNGKPLSDAHQKYLQSVTEDKLKFAYELDPSNYTNYGNYHLFIATTNYGKSEADDDAALILATKTLEFCKRDNVDPASWLTAASAAYNVMFHIGRYHENYSIPEAKESIAEFDKCIATFNELLDQAVDEGRILSATRLAEMKARAKYLQRIRYAQGQYMKRLMVGAGVTHHTANPDSNK
ncbi:MAG: hypothetical protein ACPG32_15630, partial [Akkermansiaceae bacterium]